MKYTILAKFVIPYDQSGIVIRDSLESGIQYAGCYLLSNVSNNRKDWYRKHPNRRAGYMNHSCRYAVAYEDWGNVFLKDDMNEVSDDLLDLMDYFPTHTQAVLGFQSAVNELLMEMNTAQVQHETQAYMEAAYERERREERKQVANEEFEQRLAEDPPHTVR